MLLTCVFIGGVVLPRVYFFACTLILQYLLVVLDVTPRFKAHEVPVCLRTETRLNCVFFSIYRAHSHRPRWILD